MTEVSTSKKPFFGVRRRAPDTPFTQADLTRELRAIVDNYAARHTTRIVWTKTPAREIRSAVIEEITQELRARLNADVVTLSVAVCKRAHLIVVQIDEVCVGAFKWSETSWTAQVEPVAHGAS